MSFPPRTRLGVLPGTPLGRCWTFFLSKGKAMPAAAREGNEKCHRGSPSVLGKGGKVWAFVDPRAESSAGGGSSAFLSSNIFTCGGKCFLGRQRGTKALKEAPAVGSTFRRVFGAPPPLVVGFAHGFPEVVEACGCGGRHRRRAFWL